MCRPPLAVEHVELDVVVVAGLLCIEHHGSRMRSPSRRPFPTASMPLLSFREP
jgi:hypothetical protein